MLLFSTLERAVTDPLRPSARNHANVSKTLSDVLHGLNHITLAIRDLDQSVGFYNGLLGFNVAARWDGGAYLTLNDLWLCLAVDGNTASSNDYSHIAFSIESQYIERFKTLLDEHGVQIWKRNTSEGDSVYFLDPDGHRLEAHVGDLASRLNSLTSSPYDGLQIPAKK